MYIMQNRSYVHQQYRMILQHKKWEVGTTNQTGKSYIMANRSWLQQKFDKFKKTAQLLMQEVATTHKNRTILHRLKKEKAETDQTGCMYISSNRK